MKTVGNGFGAGCHRAPFVPLGTPRLSLVALTFDHVPAVFAYASDPEISRLVAWSRHENLEASRRFVARSMVGYAEGGHYEWGLVRRSDRAFLGSCGFGELDFDRGFGELGYVLAKPYWGRGYATEAAAAVVQFGFAQLGLRLIEAHAIPENVASLRVMAKLGLRFCETKLVTDSTTCVSRPVSVWKLHREQWAGDFLRVKVSRG
jgi:ribosomal-protein-alanine N-acetyltransferase